MSMIKTKYFFKCGNCRRTLTVLVDEGERPLLFMVTCTSTVKCGWAGRFKPSEAFEITTVTVKPVRRIIKREF